MNADRVAMQENLFRAGRAAEAPFDTFFRASYSNKEHVLPNQRRCNLLLLRDAGVWVGDIYNEIFPTHPANAGGFYFSIRKGRRERGWGRLSES